MSRSVIQILTRSANGSHPRHPVGALQVATGPLDGRPGRYLAAKGPSRGKVGEPAVLKAAREFAGVGASAAGKDAGIAGVHSPFQRGTLFQGGGDGHGFLGPVMRGRPVSGTRCRV